MSQLSLIIAKVSRGDRTRTVGCSISSKSLSPQTSLPQFAERRPGSTPQPLTQGRIRFAGSPHDGQPE